MQVDEDFQFLAMGSERLFAAFHLPQGQTTRAAILCHPLGEEKLWSHRVFVTLARDLAAQGIAVLRFDYRGEGDSDRDFDDSDLETRIEDTCFAIDQLRHRVPGVVEVTLLGLRFGAAIAAAAARRRNDVSRLILWDPVTDGAAYMQSVLRMNLMYQMAIHRKVIENRDTLVSKLAAGSTVNIEGYELAHPLFLQASSYFLGEHLSRFEGKSLIVQISQSDTPHKPELLALAASARDCRVDLAIEEPFWREIKTFCQRAERLTKHSLDWLGAGK